MSPSLRCRGKWGKQNLPLVLGLSLPLHRFVCLYVVDPEGWRVAFHHNRIILPDKCLFVCFQLKSWGGINPVTRFQDSPKSETSFSVAQCIRISRSVFMSTGPDQPGSTLAQMCRLLGIGGGSGYLKELAP